MFRDAGQGWFECWPTIILQRQLTDHDELDEALAVEILERENRDPSAANSNDAAWQSKQSDFFLKSDIWRQRLLIEIESLVRHMAALHGVDVDSKKLGIQGWCVVNRNGQHHNPHVHHSSTWSGVYYIRASGEAWTTLGSDGAIEFFDQRLAKPMDENSTIPCIPKAGLLILFPSWVRHWVRPHYGTGPRICVPFNLVLSEMQ